MSRKIDAVLVLGVELDEKDQPTKELLARVNDAAKLYRKEGLPLLLCGGVLPGHGRSEASVMAEEMKKLGVPEEAFLLEEKSQNTMENMRFAAEILGEGKTVQVVTSAYHLFRAERTARRAGFKTVKGVPASEPYLPGEDEKAHQLRVRTLKRKELCFLLDLMLGWQDEGRSRPEAVARLFDCVFGSKK